jgi:hypothetical protein
MNRQQFEEGLYRYSYRLVRESLGRLDSRVAARLNPDVDAERYAQEVEQLLPQTKDIEEAPAIVRRAARQAILDHMTLK